MMGINQVIMMALALVVLACFIGAEGIGGQVWQAIRRSWMLVGQWKVGYVFYLWLLCLIDLV